MTNAALVTNSLVYSAARVVDEASRLDLPGFLDLSSLCEAAVLLDRLDVLEAADTLPDLGMIAALRGAGVLAEFTPEVSAIELRRAVLRLPEEVNRLLSPQIGGTAPERSGMDVRRSDELDPGGAVATLDYDRELDDLRRQVEEVVSYPSLDAPADPRERLLRSATYLIVATANGLDYFPDFERAPFVAAVVRHLYRSLPVQLYDRVAEALTGATGRGEEVVAEWTLDVQVPIPPVTALVLGRARRLDEVPARLLEVRAEFAGYRQHFAAFKRELQEAGTLKERRALERRYLQLLEAASGPDSEIVSATEVLNLAEKGVTAAANPFAATAYSAGLIAQPLEWLRRWWLRRPLAVLFRMDAMMPRLPEYRTLIERLWGEELGDEVLAAHLRHARQLQGMFDGRGSLVAGRGHA